MNLKLVTMGIISIGASCTRDAPTIKLPENLIGFPLSGDKYSSSSGKMGIPSSCSTLVVGEGNGQMGYQSIVIYSGYVEIRQFEEDNQLSVLVYRSQLQEDSRDLIRSLMKSSDLTKLRSSYWTEVADGAGAFLALVGEDGETYRCRMNNKFPPEFQMLWERLIHFVEKIPRNNWRYVESSDRFEIYRMYMRD